MGWLRSRSHLFGAVSVVAAIVTGAALPVVLTAAAPASSFTSSLAPVAACSPPQIPGSPVADASPPCAPTMTAEPHTGLLEGQSITVVGSGFAPNDFLPLLECVVGATRGSQCDTNSFGGFAQTDSNGAFSAGFTATGLVTTPTTTVDCARRGSCVVAALDQRTFTIEAATPVSFKNVPLPTISASPSTGLSDGQNVTLTGAHFGAGEQVSFAECPAGQTQFFNCDQNATGRAVADKAGNFSAVYSVARILSLNGGSVDCAKGPGCVVAVPRNFQELGASTPFTFDPAVPPLPPLELTLNLKPTGHVDVNGGAELSGTLSCTTKQPVNVDIQVNLTEEAGALQAVSSVATQQPCTKAPSGIAFTLADQNVPFAAGVGEVTVSLSARHGSAVADQTVSGAITLSVPPHQPAPVYYVALGDSLAAGFASPSGQGYVNDLLTHLEATVPNVQLVDLGCSSETTQTMISGGICSYPAGSQLSAAIAFLAAHRGSVVLVTIDIGGNDFLGCINASPPSYNPQCITATIGGVSTNLASMMSELRAAAGSSVPIVGMNYFDPFLDYWPDGSFGQSIAKVSVPVVGMVDAALGSVYAAAQAPVADVQQAFQTTDLTHLVKTPEGRVPVAVANACNWLDFTCAKGRGGYGTDTNAAGSSVIAGAFVKVLPPF